MPYVDPTSGGIHAQVLFLLETPARAAALRSAMLSPDNDDWTAAHVWEFYRASGLRRNRCLHWNAVPWFMGDEKKNKNATRTDIEPGLPWLAQLIQPLPDLRLVITMGGIARRAFALYSLREDARLLPWLAVAHPSPRVHNAGPGRRHQRTAERSGSCCTSPMNATVWNRERSGRDVKTGLRGWSAWERIALVTDHAWMRDGLRMLAWAVPGEVTAFRAGERQEAVACATATPEKP